MRFTKGKTLFAGGCALSALMLSTAVRAQETPAEPAAEAPALEDIVVTAQRRTERLENVPMAVSALTSNALEKANVVNMQEIGRLAAGVQINFGGVSTQPAIRGVTSLTNGTGNENNVAVYVDGFYVSDNTSINQDLANLQSIQVLKGPQGTLYGRNATGGAILINTLDPTDELTGKFEGSYGRFKDKKINGYVSAPLSEKVGFIVAGSYRNSDGWIGLSDPANNLRTKGHANPIKQRALRSKLKAELSDDLRVTLAYNYGLSSDPSGILFTPFEHILPSVPGGNQRAARFGTASYNQKTLAASKTNEVTLKIEFDTPIGTLTSYTGYAKRAHRVAFDFDGTYSDLTFSDVDTRQKTKQQAIDYVIDAIDNVDLVVGGLYFNDEYWQPQGQLNFGPNRALTQRVYKPLKTEAYAVYADATVHLSDRLTVGIGGRYSHDDREVSQTNISAAGVTTFPFTERKASFKRFAPRATARYEVADRTNVYASYSKGFRSGSFNVSPSASPALLVPTKPEDINAYEIGFKTVQSTFRFEAAAFYYDYKNLNVSLLVQNPICAGQPNCGTATVVGNAPKATVKGLDAQIAWTPVERLNITIGGAYLHARYGSFPNAIGTGLNGTTNANISGQAQDWSGNQMARAPDLSGNLNIDYTVPVGDDGELRLSGNLQYTDSYVVSNPSLFGPAAGAALATQQRFRQGSYTLANGEITWFSPDKSYWVGLYGKNLTNKSYRLTYNGGANGDYSTKAPPISYGVKVGYKF
jgi:iron complex outermembrane recepter protein